MNHIVMGTDDTATIGIWLGLLGIGVVVAVNVFANWVSWKFPRWVQHVSRATVSKVMGLAFDRLAPVPQYQRADISPYFWPNGKLPTSDLWKGLADSDFKDYRLKVFGLVENPVELSLEEIKAMGKQQQITMHNCIQGWSGIAEWGGVPLAKLTELVRPHANVRHVVFFSFGEGGEGGQYYDNHTIEDVKHPQSLLAYEMNDQPLNHVHGAPLRVRIENQLGFKQVKWIQSIEFVETFKPVYKGEGGYNEDNEYYGCKAEI